MANSTADNCQVTTRGHQKEIQQEAIKDYLAIVNQGQARCQPCCTCHAPHTIASLSGKTSELLFC